MEGMLERLRNARMLTSNEAIPFIFAGEGEFKFPEAFVARIPKAASDKEDLMRILARELRFPDYFGDNWDALTDCLRDFSWLNSYQIVLMHEGLPTQLGEDDMTSYIEILMLCVREWKLREEPLHELVVIFPNDARETIERLILE